MNLLIKPPIPTPDHPMSRWQPATWDDYVAYRDDPDLEPGQLFYHDGYLLLENMGWEGINHTRFGDLFVMLIAFWFAAKPVSTFEALGSCLMEKTGERAAAPDQALYIGGNAPRWQEGKLRRIDLDVWRVPDLVVEIADTSLASDLDRKKHLYAALKIPEYWVADIKGRRVMAFRLQADGIYEECLESVALAGLPIALLDKTLDHMTEMDNGATALWFAQQIAVL